MSQDLRSKIIEFRLDYAIICGCLLVYICLGNKTSKSSCVYGLGQWGKRLLSKIRGRFDILGVEEFRW